MGSLAYITFKCGRFSHGFIKQYVSLRSYAPKIKHVIKKPLFENVPHRFATSIYLRFYSGGVPANENKIEKPTKWQLLKKMYKEYWYIIVPVHVVTSVGWLGSFYLLSTSGFDIVSTLEAMNVSELLISQFRDSSMGHYAVTYALYKVFTPIRYTVTLGGTTFAINYLKQRGYIKPVPNKMELKEMLEKKKDEITETYRETKAGIKQRKDNIAEDYIHYREELKNLKNLDKYAQYPEGKKIKGTSEKQ